MRHAAFGLMLGRFIATVGAVSGALALAGCSSGTSRFDFPSFNLTESSQTAPAAQTADYSTTAALPVPHESVYGSEYPASTNTTQLAHGTPLPPLPSSYRPQATPASYTPTPANPAPRAYPRATAPSPQPPLVQSAPAAKPGLTTAYRVERGDTPSLIADKFGVSERSIMERNGLARADRLQVGQKLLIPGAKKQPPRKTVAAREPDPAPAPKQTTPAPDVAASPEVIGGDPNKPASNARVASVDQLPAPDPMSGNSFRWPVQGRVISGFGTKPDGGHNDGINVAVPQGTPVKAAENGVVAYSGSELKGYGNLVLIRHSNNWVSAYAHNEELLVKRGDKVRRGQIVAKAGATGSVSQPQVHFELRKGSRPIDPTKFMNNMAASAD
ncbi:MAG: peptidoglycan DD-metalloendopeptidase family protein [Methyloceanibacter sp.]|uniref:peptidoglycan DD-metalloendopeptidase family protein n=1 Tax=Methyloceanibacter sp. TaxID=1965321 RepID=UPI003D9BB275